MPLRPRLDGGQEWATPSQAHRASPCEAARRPQPRMACRCSAPCLPLLTTPDVDLAEPELLAAAGVVAH